MITRRRFVVNASAASTALALLSQGRLAGAQSPGAYRNPILGGDHPDASPIRVGSDFYLTHSSFDYAPGLLIWHSRDLVNWKPVATALKRYYGNVYAPYLCEYQGRFLIYFPADNRLRVVQAEHPGGSMVGAHRPGHQRHRSGPHRRERAAVSLHEWRHDGGTECGWSVGEDAAAQGV
jgi:xylan 1,4-beta-xylosidase